MGRVRSERGGGKSEGELVNTGVLIFCYIYGERTRDGGYFLLCCELEVSCGVVWCGALV